MFVSTNTYLLYRSEAMDAIFFRINYIDRLQGKRLRKIELTECKRKAIMIHNDGQKSVTRNNQQKNKSIQIITGIRRTRHFEEMYACFWYLFSARAACETGSVLIGKEKRKMNMSMTKTDAAVERKEGGVMTMVEAAMFLALGIVMPFLTGQIPGIGSRLLPMHIPVLICGYVCGWKYGGIVGFIVPLLRSVMFGMPPMMPTAAAMAFELAVYGSVTGILYEKLRGQRMAIYSSLIGAMIAGRLVWGIVSIPLYGLAGKGFSAQMFIGGAFLNAIPGIVLQLVLIPVVIEALRRANIVQ